MAKVTVVVTGGSGYVGSQVARLVFSHWSEVQEIRLFDKAPPQQSLITSITGFTAPLDRPKVSYYPGDCLDSDSLLQALVKADVVIHCAGVVETGSVVARKRMKVANVDGTQKVVQACLECGVRALLYTGTVLQALARSDIQRVRYDEQSPDVSNKELLYPYYGGSKNAAENLVLVADGQEGKGGVKLHTCSLRCPPMFGESDGQFVVTALKAAKRCCGFFVPLVWGNSVTMQSLYVGNGAWAHVVAAKRLLEENHGVGGKYYYVGDHSPICSMANFQAQFLHPLGYRVLPIGLPVCVLMLLACVVECVLILLSFAGVELHSPLSRSTVRYMTLSHSFSWERARKHLRYEPLYPHKTALARSMEYYRHSI